MPQGEPCHGINNYIGYDNNCGYEQTVPEVSQKGNPIINIDIVEKVGTLWN